MDGPTAEAIEKYNRQLRAIELLKLAVMEAVAPHIEPILEFGNLESMRELEDMLEPGYWQFETRIRIRYAGKIDFSAFGSPVAYLAEGVTIERPKCRHGLLVDCCRLCWVDRKKREG